jgi:hypothetical protein
MMLTYPNAHFGAKILAVTVQLLPPYKKRFNNALSILLSYSRNGEPM